MFALSSFLAVPLALFGSWWQAFMLWGFAGLVSTIPWVVYLERDDEILRSVNCGSRKNWIFVMLLKLTEAQASVPTVKYGFLQKLENLEILLNSPSELTDIKGSKKFSRTYNLQVHRFNWISTPRSSYKKRLDNN